MEIVSSIIESVRDTKRILDSAPGGTAGKLIKTYFHIKCQGKQEGPGEILFLDYRIRYLNAKTLLQLYKEIFINRYYDLPLETNTPRIIDCGSNIGISVTFFKHKYPDAKITGFEPHPITFQTLKENIDKNSFSDVEVHQMALSDKSGTIDFFVQEGEFGALDMSIVAGRGASPIMVPTQMLSAYVDEEVDLLKMDIEGAEYLVLKDLDANDKLRKFKRIICEYHHHRDSGVDNLSLTLAILEKNGFGYQLDAYRPFDIKDYSFQDVLIFAYRK